MSTISKVKTYTTIGLTGYEVTIEADTNRSLPGIDIIGLPDASVKEAKERIRSTFRSVGITLPPRKIILNLAPSYLKKIGTGFDLPMAVAILFLLDPVFSQKKDFFTSGLFFGELGLDGTVRRIDGLLPSILSAYQEGWRTFYVPIENISEVKYLADITLYGLENFGQVISHLQGTVSLTPLYGGEDDIHLLIDKGTCTDTNFSHIQGHLLTKRALTIAAGGMHNVMMIGSPGSGKTLLAKAIPSILPPLTFDQILVISQIYSVVGGLTASHPLITKRPFRVVHHTASKIAIVGGGKHLQPGEMSLAHLGILFLDELLEFPSEVLEVLRQPLEDKTITISRANGSVQYPADVMLVAAMNPCKCGYYKDRQKRCTCSLHEIKKYQSKVSGPLLDRFDLLLEVPREEVTTVLEARSLSSTENLQERVLECRSRQQKRYIGTRYSANAQLAAADIPRYIPLSADAKELLVQAAQQFNFSTRVVHKMMKLARTIADLEGTDRIYKKHLLEAIQYRAKQMFVV